MLSTSLNKIVLTDIKEETKYNKSINIDDPFSLSEFILNFDNDLENRITALEIYYKTCSSETNELINKIGMMYSFSGTILLKDFLYEIATNCDISRMLQLVAAQSLCSYNINEIRGYEALDIICSKFECNTLTSDIIPTPCKIEYISILIK